MARWQIVVKCQRQQNKQKTKMTTTKQTNKQNKTKTTTTKRAEVAGVEKQITKRMV